MPHNDNHNPFSIDKLDKIGTDTGPNTVYTTNLTLRAEEAAGSEGFWATGDGADIHTFLRLKFGFAKFNLSLEKYYDYIEFESDFDDLEINDNNKITFGVQVGSNVTDLGYTEGSHATRPIQIPTVTEIMTYYNHDESETEGYSLVQCEILDIYCQGNFNEARVKWTFPSSPGSSYPSSGAVEGSSGGYKERYHWINWPNGYRNRENLPITAGQHISTNSATNQNFLREFNTSNLYVEEVELLDDETLEGELLHSSTLIPRIGMGVGDLSSWGLGLNNIDDDNKLMVHVNQDKDWPMSWLGQQWLNSDFFDNHPDVVSIVEYPWYVYPFNNWYLKLSSEQVDDEWVKIKSVETKTINMFDLADNPTYSVGDYFYTELHFDRAQFGTDVVNWDGIVVDGGTVNVEIWDLPTTDAGNNIPFNTTDEGISVGFGVPGVAVEQTLRNAIDGYSGIYMENGMTFINNKELYLNNNNQDKRVPLGMFFFNEDNTNTLNLPIKFSEEKFNQISNINLIQNGDAKRIDKKYTSNGGENTIAFKPDGGWHFLPLQGVAFEIRDWGDDGNQNYIWKINSDDTLYTEREELRQYFEQSGNFIGMNAQKQYGYGGYYPYARLYTNMAVKYFNKLSNSSDLRDVFFDAYKFTSGMATSGGSNQSAPEIATWVDFSTADEDLAYSNKKCLVLSGLSEYSSQSTLAKYWNLFKSLDPNSDDALLPWILPDGNPDNDPLFIEENKYRVLNQTQKIYDATDGTLHPYSALKVKFKMKTTRKNDDDNSYPPVEVGILSCDIWDSGSPMATPVRDKYAESRGSFNSYTYPNTSYVNQKNYDFGGMNRVENTEMGVWQDFEFDFTLTDRHITMGQVKTLNFFVQSSGPIFTGQVMLDDFEVYESYDFYPDCDVRMKKGANEYGVGDLTKYYDPTIPNQLEAYNDTVAPMETQFYFYPRYPSNQILGVDRTIQYEAFKRGLFYIYDIDWGDGSSKEFTTEPEKIDEEKALYHTYKESGVYEITGYMLRLKEDKDGNQIGLINNKKFKLRININEGLDEDFTFLSSDGFSFIPYKNTLPIVGGHSKQSSYYKTIKRMLGFLEDNTRTNIKYKNISTKLKLERALLKMDESYKPLLDSNSMGGILPYFNSYNNVLLTEGDLSAIVDKENYYINSLGLVSGILDIRNDTVQFSYYTGEEQGEWWKFELTQQSAQAFEYLTGTDGEDQRQGWLSELNSNFTDEYKAVHIIDAGSTNVDTGWSSGYFGGVYQTERSNNTYTKGLYKQFDGTSYTLYVAPAGFQSSQNFPDVTVEVDNSAEPKLYFTPYFESEELSEDNNEEPPDFVNHDVFNDDSNIHGMSLASFNVLSDDAQAEYMDKLGTLPFPRYFQEFDFFGNSGITQDGSSYAWDDLFANIPRWEELGRFDISFYLTIMESFQSMVDDITNEQLIDLVYEWANSEYNNLPQNWLYNALNNEFPPNNLFTSSEVPVNNGLNPLLGELGNSLNTVDLTSVKYYNKPKSIFELIGFQSYDFNQVGNPNNERYWKNIIPEDYDILDREGLPLQEGEGSIDTYSQQDWMGGYYYPVLPRYGSDGKFIEGDFPNNKIPFPVQGNITNEQETKDNLLINITSEVVENNVFNDLSGNGNLGFSISDYKPSFDNKTLKPTKRKTFQRTKKSKSNGAF